MENKFLRVADKITSPPEPLGREGLFRKLGLRFVGTTETHPGPSLEKRGEFFSSFSWQEKACPELVEGEDEFEQAQRIYKNIETGK
jgi:hypothetical protein